MKTSRSVLAATALIASLLVSGAAIFAQTEVPTAPASSFSDGRINGDIDLGGLAIYCVDQSANTHVNTFQNGGIEVWGVGGQKYITLTADQLRGNMEIPQPPATMEASMTETPSSSMMTPEATAMATSEVSPTPVLLAQAATPNGKVGFFSLGNDNFALQGTDETGKFFTYMWTGCGMGSIDTNTKPFAAMPMMAATEMMTPEATAAS